MMTALRQAEELQYLDQKETKDSEESDDLEDNYEDAMMVIEGGWCKIIGKRGVGVGGEGHAYDDNNWARCWSMWRK